MTTVIYTLRDPRSDLIRYVGVTKQSPHQRLYAHISQAKNAKRQCYRTNWILSLLADNVNPVMEIIEDVDGINWQDRERCWIAFYREAGMPLCNTSDGGEGSPGVMKSASTRMKLSMASKGRILSPATRLRMSESRKGRLWSEERKHLARANRKPRSAETRRKFSESRKGHPVSLATREKIRTANKGFGAGIPLSPLHRKKIGQALKGRTISIETRKKLSDASKRRMMDPAVRTRISEKLKGRKVPPDTLKRRVLAQTGLRRSDEAKANIREGMRRSLASNK